MSWEEGHFKSYEFECKCGCGLDKVDRKFLWKLNQAREEANIPFSLSSGCRCEQRNKDEGGYKTSDHLPRPYCEGADIKVSNSRDRFKVVDAAISVGFKRIGIAKTFIHLGSRELNPQRVIWVY
jgi:zinc D-Ala-D-Ala carboxypeptidase